MKLKDKRIETFKKSLDYRDINYFLEHVNKTEFRKSLIEELGYRIGLDVTKEINVKGNVYLNRNKQLRMFISNRFKNICLAYCVIFENY